MGEIIALMVPIMTSAGVSVAADRFTMAFAGHWDYKDVSHFDGVAIGKMYSNVTGLSIGTALLVGLSTLCAQANGAGKASVMNPIYLRRSWAILGVCCVFSFLTSLFCEPILLLCGQPASVARTSAKFSQIQFVGVPFFWFGMSMSSILGSMKIVRPGLVASLGSSVVQVLLCWLFVNPDYGNFGYLGLAMGRALGGIFQVLLLIMYIKCAGLSDRVWVRKPNSEAVFKKGAISEYLKIALPASFGTWCEWWAFEVLALEVGLTQDAEINLAAHGIMLGYVTVVYMCWIGTMAALSILVGNRIGARLNSDLLPLLRCAFVLSLCTSLVVAAFYQVFQKELAAFFTADTVVREIITSSSFGVIGSILFYAQMKTFCGALQAANRQSYSIGGTVLGYWVIGLPAGAIFGIYLKMPTPLVGVWIGNVVALAISAAFVLFGTFCRVDWMTVERFARMDSPLLAERPQDDGVAARGVDGGAAEKPIDGHTA